MVKNNKKGNKLRNIKDRCDYMEDIKDFLFKYGRVFDESGNIRLCGRNACADLIEACQKIASDKSVYYGNMSTGFMEVENIQNLYKKVSF